MKLFATSALLAEGWRENVLFEIDGDRILGATADSRAPAGAERAAGAVIPGMPNLHSHAFQRALAGLAERRDGSADGFWHWRRTMYRFLARLGAEEIEAIAAWLYVEMLEAGYTAVAEFHYLHHDIDGRRYADAGETSARILAAAGRAGIALTLLPVLYRYRGFGALPPQAAQCRFVHEVDAFAHLANDLEARARAAHDARVGIALHSLRAVGLDDARAVLAAVDAAMPVHIHIAEQQREVDECVAWCGRRPLQLLLDELPIDSRWCLVHATHVDVTERDRMAACGAVAGLCPTTEANLGDGVFPAAAYCDRGGALGIGSDSHVTVSPFAELRLLEYGQRLLSGRRAVLASASQPSTGRRLWEQCAVSGAHALGIDGGTLAAGRRADLLVLDTDLPIFHRRRDDEWLDAAVFAAGANPVRDVMVAGAWRVRNHRHPHRDAIAERFRAALDTVAARAAADGQP